MCQLHNLPRLKLTHPGAVEHNWRKLHHSSGPCHYPTHPCALTPFKNQFSFPFLPPFTPVRICPKLSSFSWVHHPITFRWLNFPSVCTICPIHTSLFATPSKHLLCRIRGWCTSPHVWGPPIPPLMVEISHTSAQDLVSSICPSS